MDNLELVRSFESLATNPSAKVVTDRLLELAKAEITKLANGEDQVALFRAQGRYQAILEISRWFDLSYLADLKKFMQEKK